MPSVKNRINFLSYPICKNIRDKFRLSCVFSTYLANLASDTFLVELTI